MSVKELCTHNVATVGRDADMTEAAKRMRDSHVGDLVVTEYRDGREIPVGLVTDRDIVVEVVAKAMPADQVKAEDAMSRGLVTVREDNSIDYALEQMQRAGVRRVPVVDDRGRLIGLLAMDDIIKHLVTQLTHISGAIYAEQAKETRNRA